MFIGKIDFFRSAAAFFVGLAGLAVVGCSSSGDGNGTPGTGGTVAIGTGGSVGSGGAGSGTGGATGTGGAATGSGGAGTTGSGGAGTGGTGIDAPVDTVTDVPAEAAPDVPAGPFALTSTAFTNGMNIPLMYKCAQAGNLPMGMNISPPLAWTPGPAGTMSYAITLNHDAADQSKHWAIWDIPVATTSLPMNVEHATMPAVPAGSKQVHLNNLDGFTGDGYQGPCPQAQGAQQSYLFNVYALKVATLPTVTSQSSSDAVFTAILANVVSNGKATLRVTQTRQ